MSESDVRKASEQFYAALNKMIGGDASGMGHIWSHSDDVTTLHPIGGRQVGWADVGNTWEMVSKAASGGHVKIDDQHIHAAGDMAYEVGVERGSLTLAGQQVSFEDRVTNVYRREAGGWKIVHHHTDISQKMVDIVSKLQPPR